MIRPEELAERLSAIPATWLTLEERLCLLKYAGLAKDNIVEIGTAWGGSACILVLGSSVHVYSVDPFQEPLCNVGGWKITPEAVREKVQEVLGNRYGQWELWVRPSDYVANYFRKGNEYYLEHFKRGFIDLGLVFIDGNHDYDYVKQDVSLWLPLIQSGGYLILHDSANRDLSLPGNEQYIGPHRVAAELAEDKRVRLIETAFSMTVWEVL
jgi:hypothetical protein